MVIRTAGLLAQATLLAASMTACERQDAAAHRAAVDAIRAATADLQSAAALGDDAARALTSIASDLRGIQGGSKALDAARDRLLCQTEVRLADVAWQSGVEDRGEAESEAAAVASLSEALKDQTQRLTLMEMAVNRIDTDTLSLERMSRAQSVSRRSQDQEEATAPVEQRQSANAADAAEALSLRTRASSLRTRARSVDAITGQPLLEEAARLDHKAASIEAAMDRRASEVDLHHDMVLETASLHAGLSTEGLDVVDEELRKVERVVTAAHDGIAAEQAEADRIADSLRESTSALINSLTGPLSTHYDDAINHLRKASKAATSAIRAADRSAKEGDRIAAIRVSIATMAIAGARRAELEGGLRLLTAAGGTSPESRQVLQDLWDTATTTFEDAQEAARSQASSLGGDAGALLLNAMGEPAGDASD